MQEKKKYIFIAVVLLFTYVGSFVRAQNAEDIKNKIDERNNQIKQLEEEIKQYNIEVENSQNQSKTLQSTLKTLDLTKKKISTDISLTQQKINKTSLTIEELDQEIENTKTRIDTNKKAIETSITNMRSLEDIGMLAMVLSHRNISDIWTDIDTLGQVQRTIQDNSKELAKLQVTMEAKQNSLVGQKKNLLGFKQDLDGKKQAVDYTTKQQAELLIQTKNKEQTFKQLVQTKEEQKEQFEKEMYELESQLNILIDKGSYPVAKKGILSWPLDTIFITQHFGKTVGAEKLYVSGSHNGMDFRASIGTKVKNVLDGVVTGVGDTGAYPYTKCISWGRWVVVKHPNGLSTLYSHLSVISVRAGQQIHTGDVIGYSGNTGYSTGPHLHLSLFATQGLRMEKFVNSVGGCKEVVMPIVDAKAYLDPFAYFPAI
jgi:murein DD-endopeptidase MepM/ murein hydrolase activator NlpD